MTFFISAETADALTLTPVAKDKDSRYRSGRVAVGGGVIFSIVAFCVVVSRWDAGADPFNLIMSFMVFGSAFMVVIVRIFMQAKEEGVAAFVFDRHLGAVRVRNQQGQPTEAYIAYADILDLSVQEMSQDPGNSMTMGGGGGGGLSRNYHAVVHLRDGGSWYLTNEYTREDAEKQVGQLAAAVRAGSHPTQAVPPPELPPQVTLSTQGRETTLRWGNPLIRQEVVWRLGWAIGMGWMMVVISQGFAVIGQAGDPLRRNLALVVGLLAVLLVGWELWKMRREASTGYALVFTPETVSYLEKSLLTGQETHRESTPLSEWYGLSFSFNDEYGVNEAMLRLTKSAHAHYLKEQQTNLSFRERLALLTEKNEARPLLLKRLSPVQRLAVVNWAQATVRSLRS